MLGAQGSIIVPSAPVLGAGAKIDVQSDFDDDELSGASPHQRQRSSRNVTTGFGHGSWADPGIDTSTSASHLGLGWKDSASSQSIEVKYTYYGDSNLDGVGDQRRLCGHGGELRQDRQRGGLGSG